VLMIGLVGAGTLTGDWGKGGVASGAGVVATTGVAGMVGLGGSGTATGGVARVGVAT
jgi:hypothetical protein